MCVFVSLLMKVLHLCPLMFSEHENKAQLVSWSAGLIHKRTGFNCCLLTLSLYYLKAASWGDLGELELLPRK